MAKNKKTFRFYLKVFLRRVRDSNPRTCYSQQFSRLPQSTTLPTLLNSGSTVVFSGANIERFLIPAKLLEHKF